jgi:hypothetical protein
MQLTGQSRCKWVVKSMQLRIELASGALTLASWICLAVPVIRLMVGACGRLSGLPGSFRPGLADLHVAATHHLQVMLAVSFGERGGVNAEDALVHASLYLQAAYVTANEACNQSTSKERGLHLAALYSVEIAKALVDALLDGAEGLTSKQASPQV